MRGTIAAFATVAAMAAAGEADAKFVYRHIMNAAPEWSPSMSSVTVRADVPNEVAIGAATDRDSDALIYVCASRNGSTSMGPRGMLTVAPSAAGAYRITCAVSDGHGGVAEIGIDVTASAA